MSTGFVGILSVELHFPESGSLKGKRRVNESVRQVLSEAVGELKDPRIGFVTVTGVETSPDLRHAKVFVSVLGSEEKRTQSLAGLEAAHGVLQARVARELRLKRTPQLAFE